MKNPRSTTLSPEGARSAAAVLVSLSALSVVTCATATRAGIAPSPAVAPSPAAPAAAPSVVVAPPPATVAAPPPTVATTPAIAPSATAAEEAHQGSLQRFRAALRDAPHRAEPVRVLWLGDSHAAADFWPDAVRKPLQAGFGVGGPGFLYVGLGVYRHAGVKLSRDGKWRVEPRLPSLSTRQDDGVFGLGGMRAVPEDATSQMRFVLSPDAVRGKARWDVAFRLPTNKARFSVAVVSGETRVVDATTAPVGAIAHVALQTECGATVTLGLAAGEPELLGVSVESTAPGVVVDTLGINGARIATPLAWDTARWVDEARLRKPALVVVAYGTNEVGDQVAPFRYGPELESLVQLSRQAAPSSDCLVVGPTDRLGAGFAPLPRLAEIEAVERQTAERIGCAYFSAIDAMGGEGSFKTWAEQDPPLAAMDHVHLTPRGYAELGTDVAKLLLGL